MITKYNYNLNEVNGNSEINDENNPSSSAILIKNKIISSDKVLEVLENQRATRIWKRTWNRKGC
jgi:hypothetical protein